LPLPVIEKLIKKLPDLNSGDEAGRYQGEQYVSVAIPPDV
jgi:hypothetical protein